MVDVGARRPRNISVTGRVIFVRDGKDEKGLVSHLYWETLVLVTKNETLFPQLKFQYPVFYIGIVVYKN